MALEPSKFHPMVVTDTCSVWNILSSRRLFQATCSTSLFFCITPMVLYECVQKPRKAMPDAKAELLKRLVAARQEGRFPLQYCDLDDLATITRNAPIALSSGELSCIAVAYQTVTMGVMTDEKQARRFAEKQLHLVVETTPRLYAWLHYHRHLSDGDHSEIIAEHEKHEGRPLSRFLNEAYEAALHHRVYDLKKKEEPPLA